ncbi:hypothetical protein ARMGADRAFT_1083115 [Armillaria gallica]|uniref:F-box domain-containing protein n=1 Tax=Armillaria gallica TaxID=47427 RepID=A0A2H3D4R7_ARMGA|nr:hypothetical protein ARMGADRAFT_1083115 [Armillaria gallica]
MLVYLQDLATAADEDRHPPSSQGSIPMLGPSESTNECDAVHANGVAAYTSTVAWITQCRDDLDHIPTNVDSLTLLSPAPPRTAAHPHDDRTLAKRDFLYCLPAELALHILSWVNGPKTLGRASQVSRHRRKPVEKDMRTKFGGRDREDTDTSSSSFFAPLFSYKSYFKYSCSTNWRHGCHLLRVHRMPIVNPTNGLIISIILNDVWVVVLHSRIHDFLTLVQVAWLRRSWATNPAFGGVPSQLRRKEECLIMDEERNTASRFGLESQDEEEEEDDDIEDPHFGVCGASEGWCPPNSLVVSVGCDKVIWVWDIKSGYCIYALHGPLDATRCCRTDRLQLADRGI